MSPRTQARTRGQDRVVLRDDSGGAQELRARLARGLTGLDKHLPVRRLLDGEPARLLDRLRQLPDAFVDEAERRVLAERAYSLRLYFPGGTPDVLELGTPWPPRSSALLEPLAEHFGDLRYEAWGLPARLTEEACRELAAAHPGVQVTCVLAPAESLVRDLRRPATRRRLLFWPGGRMGRLDRSGAVGFLRGLASVMSGADLLLMGVDLRKDRRLVERTHDDRKGLSKLLYLSLLERVNEELDAALDVSLFRYRVEYDEDAGRLDAFLVSRRGQQVAAGALESPLQFNKGERVHLGSFQKYAPQEIDQLAQAAGMVVLERWYERDGRYAVNLLRVQPR